MKKNAVILLLFSSIFLVRCTQMNIEEYNINPIMEIQAKIARKSMSRVRLQLCDDMKFKFDSLIIVPPYTPSGTIKDYKLSNSKLIEDIADSFLDETKCLLVFTENKTIVKYGFVNRYPIDFIYINGKQGIRILTRKMVCNELYIGNNIKGELKLFL